MWTYLAFNDDRRLLPAACGMPAAVRCDDPPALLPHRLFHPDGRAFFNALERLTAVRQPWLRRIHDSMKDRPYLAPFA
ncbi:hypothetical protein ABT158_20310 [Nonomuraea sp. NPDC001636]|uniref:hypothetical protein n=1 Tax=Nonomuraea sp. NPDC001636 TaxID=3154391 RepID=UPI003323BF7E